MRPPGSPVLSSKHFTCHYSSFASALPQTPPPSIPPSPHHSLATFLAHARRTSLSRKSSLYIGTRYEYLCLSALSRLSFCALTRTGGRDDLGIDLQGQWALPTLPFELPALVSCKASKGGVGPDIVRELEGTVGRRGGVGVLMGRKEATKGVREAVRRSAVGVMWVMVEEVDRKETGGQESSSEGDEEQEDAKIPVGKVRQILWNEKVEMMGATGLGVGVRYFEGESGKLDKEVCLTWKGRIWEPGVDGMKPELASRNSYEVAKDEAPTVDTRNTIEGEE